jgi:hypothetical protein
MRRRLLLEVICLKKKLVLTVVIAIAFVCISIYLLQPRLIAKDIDLLDTVIHNVDNEERTDITEQIDLDLLKEIIGRYKCSRIPHSFSPYQG